MALRRPSRPTSVTSQIDIITEPAKRCRKSRSVVCRVGYTRDILIIADPHRQDECLASRRSILKIDAAVQARRDLGNLSHLRLILTHDVVGLLQHRREVEISIVDIGQYPAKVRAVSRPSRRWQPRRVRSRRPLWCLCDVGAKQLVLPVGIIGLPFSLSAENQRHRECRSAKWRLPLSRCGTKATRLRRAAEVSMVGQAGLFPLTTSRANKSSPCCKRRPVSSVAVRCSAAAALWSRISAASSASVSMSRRSSHPGCGRDPSY